jgi:hypothetical protein
MSLVPVTALHGEMSDAELRAAAREAYRASLAAGQPITGAELGRRFGLSDRWGRARVAEVRGETAADRHGQPAGRDRGQPNRDTGQPAQDTSKRPVRSTPSRGTGATGPAGRRREAPAGDGKVARWLRSAITLAVGLVAAAVSYGHMMHVALLAGEPLWAARVWPITVDGLVLAALLRGEQSRVWLAVGAAVSVAANVLNQYPELAEAAGPVVSAWPPLALYGTHRLFHPRNRRTRTNDDGAHAQHIGVGATPGRTEG